MRSARILQGASLAFRVHREFYRSFKSLSAAEQRAVARAIQEHASGIATPGMRLHKVGEFLSISPNMDIRVLSTRRGSDFTYFYVGHHDDAYRWAERNLPIVVNESVELLPASIVLAALEIAVAINPEITLQDILGRLAEATLTDDELLTAIAGLSPEWQEWFFRSYVENEMPRPDLPTTCSYTTTVLDDQDLLEALSLPTSSWQIFLHPTQRYVVEIDSLGIAISGPPGSGKTVILMQRFLRESGDPSTKILATYSDSLVGHLRDMAGDRGWNYSHRIVFNNELSRTPTAGSSGFVVDGDRLIHVNQNGRKTPIDELLIDEFQDSPKELLELARRILLGGKTRLVVAFDLEQALFRANAAEIVELASRCEQHVRLSFVYRSSREIMTSAAAVSADLRNALSFGAENHRATYGISGPPIVFLETSSMKRQIRCCNEIIEGLEARYKREDLALIYVQHFNPSFSGKSAEEAALKNHPRLGDYYRFASTVKGREFKAGALFVSDSYLARQDVGRTGLELRINTFYMAATRFRDELTVVYRSESPFARLIETAPVVRVHDREN